VAASTGIHHPDHRGWKRRLPFGSQYHHDKHDHGSPVVNRPDYQHHDRRLHHNNGSNEASTLLVAG
jgi:hypothetical protein